MKSYGIARRELAGVAGAARLAISRGKRKNRRAHYIDEHFFGTWNPVMAYVVGVICSDGCLTNRGTFRIDQKEPELLLKVRALMKSTDDIRFRPKMGVAGAIYSLRVSNVKVYEDLIRIGLTPKKSLTIHFPAMPSDCVRHFIRGCWDGDGSIYFEDKNLLKPRASYVSGSKAFIEAMVKHLAEFGLSIATIHKYKRSRAYYMKYGPVDCAKLYHILYDGVDQGQFLNRKHEMFRAAADKFGETNDLQERLRLRRRHPTARTGKLSQEIRSATDALKKEMGIHL
jgi:hypothetical protein